MSKPVADESVKIITQNRKARHDYHIIESFEAGIVLTGAEVKSIRNGGVSIAEGYIRPEGTELFLYGAHIQPYSHKGTPHEYQPTQRRKLLMHAQEIDRLTRRVNEKGLTLVALTLYFKKGRVKLELALAKGKASPDKRESIKKREAERDMARAMRGKPRDRGR